ncbi:hypothetical protein B0A50_04494 [Salinomyces thailandicus]|uniref:SnoaL-like domain-containing protein n=1 Tax=Salinomyces thailandicus TaxID=706561 RepID=A0A4U0TXP7_9PEZI|nr:hypothetical protein B0A50_04494 [Salinomyces thailandica]
MDNAAWPSQTVPDPIKDLVAHFYSIVDSEGTNTGVKLAEDIFTDDGELIINKRNWVGSDSISEWRAGGESVILRSHEVDKIYVCNDEGDDLLMTGKLTLGSEIGLTAESPFCARCVVDDATASSPRVRTWQMWTDYTPFFDLGILRPPVTKMSDGILDTIGGR